MNGYPSAQGLYDPRYEHESCGVGFICQMKGKASHDIVDDALRMLENMSHRGACGCEVNSGDGSGIMALTPDTFLRRQCARLGIHLPPQGQYGVGMVFLPQDLADRYACQRIFEKVALEYGIVTLGWRDVPVNSEILGPTPRRSEPKIRQVYVTMGVNFYNRKDFDRRLYLVRQRAENVIEFNPDLSERARKDFYICCLSANRIIYKGMLTANQVRQYYPDLSDPDFSSAMAMVHSRFSTNTFPSWDLAHPYRYLAHNGEINTLRGNRNWMRARFDSLQSEVFGDELRKMFPIVTESGSDSATLDNAMQLLAVNGRSLPHAALMLIPEAWQNHTLMDPDLRAFYEYHACLMEPWDGPASVTFTNGSLIGAVLDRNGLRPSRYYVTDDDRVIMASEVGALPVPAERVRRKWRLQPGKIFLIDMKQGRIIDDQEVKADLVNQRPWRKWLNENLIDLAALPSAAHPQPTDHETLRVRQHAFGYSTEDLRILIGPMAVTGKDPIGSMGNDAALACLSDRPQLLYNYFKQLFAQVTNPPLDSNFEALVTSLYTYLGREENLLEETPRHCHLIKLKQPILDNEELEKLRGVCLGDLRAVTLPMLFDAAEGAAGLQKALDELCASASKAIDEGASILILSDRGVNATLAPIPSLLATSAVHHHLIRQGTRTRAGLVIETGEAREVHHFCLLIGYGAGAVNPYLAFETLEDMKRDHALPNDLTLEEARHNYIKAANKGIIKVASKMGISTVQSYRGAQIFEAIGLSRKLVDRYFTGTASRLDGIGLDIIAEECLERHRQGFPPIAVDDQTLKQGGVFQWRRGGEEHSYNPETVAKMQHAVRWDANSYEQLETGVVVEGYEKFKEYSRLVNDESQARRTLRGMMRFKKGQPVPLEEVEPAKEIVKRFATGAMSFGSISKEAHENIAIAMNRIGGKSNSGEGGEDSSRFLPDAEPDAMGRSVWRRSAIKQVASARFGVTSEFLINADDIQIKMAQGAKPGEGGQLPGYKVDEYIGKIRHSTPGVGLISPPPHHDIYSIEDLAQLIHDLKSVNPKSRVSVKLVSEVGVGTVAAGVAKAKADHILISGDSGGTGASPQTSIKHAGIPWELGLAETQQVLVMNNLRGRVVVQADGQIKTGRDAAIAVLLGAEEIGFATAPLIASGCIMMRVCHLNTCPVGIATQDPELRKKFSGHPEHVINFMFFVAEELREIMAELGFRTVSEMCGRTDMLEFEDVSDHWKARTLDLSVILHRPTSHYPDAALHNVEKQDHGLERSLDQTRIIPLARRALETGRPVSLELPITNVDRAVGATLSGEIAAKHGFKGLPDDTISVTLKGHAGQSFGAFLARGVTLRLEGDANDYVGKGCSGGRIAVYPPADAAYRAQDNIIAGNVIGYGAVDGEIYLRGVVGERFCVRNSGVKAVVEGCGDHGCEYMTGGRVLVIGPTGRNFAAGMSGGIAYVYCPPDDRREPFRKLCNQELVSLERPDRPEDIQTIRTLLENHARYTASPVAADILADFEDRLRFFVKVMPNDYRRVLEHQAEIDARAASLSQLRVIPS